MSISKSAPFFGVFGDELRFISAKDCRPHAPQLAWRPQARNEYWRSQSQQERYFVQLYFRWLFEYDLGGVRLPLVVRRAGGRKEPDFILVENGTEIGLEVTRATTQLFQTALRACLRSDWRVEIEMTPELGIEFGPERNEQFDKRSYHRSHLVHEPGAGYDGDGGFGAEQCWADTMAFHISKKLEKLRSHYRETVGACDLLLYSDVPAPAWDLPAALSLLRKSAVSSCDATDFLTSFRQVQIVCDHWAIFDALGVGPKIFAMPNWALTH